LLQSEVPSSHFHLPHHTAPPLQAVPEKKATEEPEQEDGWNQVSIVEEPKVGVA
jgi:hypothetical protein